MNSSILRRYGLLQHKKYILLVMAIVFALAGYAQALSGSEITFVNSVSTGAVKIDVVAYRMDSGRRIAAADGMLYSTENISYIPEISSSKAPCFVRLRAELVSSSGVVVSADPDRVYGINDKWIYRNGYYYLTDILWTGESSQVFEGLLVSDIFQNSAGKSEGEKKFTVRLRADSLQASGVIPDFSSQDPWGTVAVGNSRTGGGIRYGISAGYYEAPVLTFTEEGVLKSNRQNLFAGFDYLMAGDVATEILEIRNRFNESATIYFRTDVAEGKLPENATLFIYAGDKAVYSGKLASRNLSEYIRLAEIPEGMTCDFEFVVSLPAEKDNDFNELSGIVKWQFMAETMDDTKDAEGPEDTKDTEDTEERDNAGKEKYRVEPEKKESIQSTVRTGDSFPMYLVFLLLSALCGILALKYTKNDRGTERGTEKNIEGR